VCVDPDGPPCPCGSTGCLERYAGKHAILAAAGLSRQVTPEELAHLARSGEPRAKKAVSRAARALGVALAGAINLLDIPAVVLGGHLGQIADVLTPDLERQLRTRVLSARWVVPQVSPAGIDLAPGAGGGALAVLSSVLANPARWVG
jgi:predicted NBD/HSP70 family sugar kinase